MTWKKDSKRILKEDDGQQLIQGLFRESDDDAWSVEYGIHWENGFPSRGTTKEISQVISEKWAKAILLLDE